MGWDSLEQISSEKQKEISELVKKQEKAKVSWISTITQVPEEVLISNASIMGLQFDGENLLFPSVKDEETKDHTKSTLEINYGQKKTSQIQSNKLAIASFFCALLSIPSLFIPFAGWGLCPTLFVLGIIFGIVGLKLPEHKELAIAGLVLGGIDLIVGIIIMALVLPLLGL